MSSTVSRLNGTVKLNSVSIDVILIRLRMEDVAVLLRVSAPDNRRKTNKQPVHKLSWWTGSASESLLSSFVVFLLQAADPWNQLKMLLEKIWATKYNFSEAGSSVCHIYSMIHSANRISTHKFLKLKAIIQIIIHIYWESSSTFWLRASSHKYLKHLNR